MSEFKTIQFPTSLNEHDKYFIFLEVYEIEPLNINIVDRVRDAGSALAFAQQIARDAQRVYNYESRQLRFIENFMMPFQQSITEVVGTSFEPVETRNIQKFSSIATSVLGGDLGEAFSTFGQDRLSDSPVGQIADTALGRTKNPNEQLNFKGVERRSWSFTIPMLARNINDARALQNIRKRLQFHALPGLQQGNLFWKYPHIFRFKFVKYNHRDRSVSDIENLFYSKLCFMENVSVKNGSDKYDEFTDGVESYPGSIEVSLTLKETEILSKRDYTENSNYLTGWRPRG